MRYDRVETYEASPGAWHANTLDEYTFARAVGRSETEALANLCEELMEHLYAHNDRQGYEL